MFGLEAQGDWASLRASHISAVNPTLTSRAKVTGLGLFTGQIGYAWDATLLYVRGGAAVTSNKYDQFATVGGAQVNFASSTHWGC